MVAFNMLWPWGRRAAVTSASRLPCPGTRRSWGRVEAALSAAWLVRHHADGVAGKDGHGLGAYKALQKCSHRAVCRALHCSARSQGTCWHTARDDRLCTPVCPPNKTHTI